MSYVRTLLVAMVLLAATVSGCGETDASPSPSAPATSATAAPPGDLSPAVEGDKSDAGSILKRADLNRIFNDSFQVYSHHTYQNTGVQYVFNSKSGRNIAIESMTGQDAVNGWAFIQKNVKNGTLKNRIPLPSVHPTALSLLGEGTLIQFCIDCTATATAKYFGITLATDLRVAAAVDPALIEAAKLAVSRLS